ncbi:MAG: MBL fold metallo-hydrolase [Lachnospiraceae bacterium]|nr:MBL fold metallo-hydrolase [Lachnospiraceae bacterium]MBR1857725.1 MBL fold metallo-hydrolase [Oribacterium sp.]
MDDKTKHGFIIDPGAQAKGLLGIIKENGWTIEKILLTHGHFDHTGAVDGIRIALDIPVLAHRRSDEYLLDARKNLSALCGPAIIVENVKYMDDGDVIEIDSNPDFHLEVIYVPGHTTDSVMFYSEADHVAFVGDTIFKGSIGNYLYPGGDPKDLQRSIIERIFTLPDDTVLCSGHSEQTTVGIEKSRYR